MKTTIKLIPEFTIEEFAAIHNLKMEIRERPLPPGDPLRFYASFKSIEEKRDGVLISIFGNGSTQEMAIEQYAARIHLKHLVFDSMGNRKEINPTRITVEASPRED